MSSTSLCLYPVIVLLVVSSCVQVEGSKAPAGAISAAVNTAYNLNVRNVATQHRQPLKPQRIDIESNNIPLVLHFKSASSRLKIMQSHRGSEGEMHKSLSEDEPDILLHTVRKPVIQEIREIISPFRKTVQEIKPVQEEIETIVSQDKSNSDQAEEVYPVNSVKQKPNTVSNVKSAPNRSMNAAPSTFEDSPTFPGENYIPNRMNRNEPTGQQRHVHLFDRGTNSNNNNDNNNEGSVFNWMQSFRDEDFSRRNSQHNNNNNS